ncbi:MAG: sporulation related domain protein, partial [Hyphomicrobiales bacterium]|nr:sporulation related domain protein [Hyphomicrobiales bacterium]
MSEAARVRESIDLEEFERRLRGPAPAPAPREHASLDEFARLMASGNGGLPPMFAQGPGQRDGHGGHDHARDDARHDDRTGGQAAEDPYYKAALAALSTQSPQGQQPAAAPPVFAPPAFAPSPLLQKSAPARAFEPASQPAAAPPVMQASRPDFLQAYARDRQPEAPPEPQNEPQPQEAQYAPQHEARPDVWRDGDAPPAGVLVDEPVAPRRSRKASLLLGGAIAVLVLGVGATLATRNSVTGSGEAPTIKAASGPVKIQPETPKTGDQPAQSASILDRNGSERIAGSRVVNREEQPV